MVTRNPRACKSLASEAEIIPLPSEEVTPPVTKIYFAADAVGVGVERSGMTGDKSSPSKIGTREMSLPKEGIQPWQCRKQVGKINTSPSC
ncbi:hypothetical protein GCM10027511_23530 [Hymenobacter humi]